MATVAIIVAAGLAAALVARELVARRRLRALQDEIDRLRDEARDTSHVAGVGALLSGIAKELKDPLQGVIGNAELMLASGAHRGSHEELREIQENATRAAGIVRNLLAFSETTTITRRWQDVNELIRRAVEGCRPEMDALGVRVSVNRGDRVPLVYVDGRQLEKVIATLLSRPAPRRAARDVAAVAVATYKRPNQDDCLIIEVDDRGALDAGDAASWSGDLAACRQILEAHGGVLDVRKPAGGGCLFHLELPLTSGVLTETQPHG